VQQSSLLGQGRKYFALARPESKAAEEVEIMAI
jgi:hypothetical protein